jgi:hypothetical protein
MFTAESIKLLAKHARRHTDRARHFDQNIDVQICEPAPPPPIADDPNDSPDPDDSARNPDAEIPPPEMPAEWWTRMALDPDQTPVTATDVQTVFEFISRRLRAPSATTGAIPPLADATPVCVLPSQGGGRQTQSNATADVEFASVTTVGELHESVAQHFGPAGWTALVSFWQQAVGIQQPGRQPKPGCAPIIAVETDRKADTPLPPLPSSAFQMEEGLRRALPEMPGRVAAFLLHTPRDPPAWRYQESAEERAERQALENLGAWTG